jgi:hypothetical protein
MGRGCNRQVILSIDRFFSKGLPMITNATSFSNTTFFPVPPGVTRLALLALTALASFSAAQAQDFATSVVSSSGLGSNKLYNDPSALLGQPTTLINGIYDRPPGTYHASMVYSAYNKDPQNNDLIDVLGNAGTVTVAFDTPIVHSGSHWYSDDFIVYGNSFFSATGSVKPTTDMTQLNIGSSGGLYQSGTPQVSVSADGFTFQTLTAQSAWFPTNPYKWVGISSANPSGWDDMSGHLNDFTKPINPALTTASFGGDNVADAANRLYDDSAGGAAFTLAGSGLSSIQYIRFTGTGGSSVVDAVSRVSDMPVPEASTFCSFGLGGLLLAGIFAFARKKTFSTN